VNAELRKQNPDLSSSEDEEDGEEWKGVEDAVEQVEAPQQEEEDFVDEDKFTTVTVEPMDDFHEAVNGAEDDDGGVDKRHGNGDAPVVRTKVTSKGGDGQKKKKRKFRYESKAERAATRHKQKSKNHAAKVRRKGK
jgi:ribosomal RNA-processing protein 17